MGILIYIEAESVTSEKSGMQIVTGSLLKLMNNTRLETTNIL